MRTEQTTSDVTQVATDQEPVVSRQQVRKTLRQRAEALARKPEEEKAHVEYVDTVALLLADEKYAVEISYVREVLRLKGLTLLPCTPPFVLGAINVRGQILSVIDLRKLFDLPEKGLTDQNNVIIAHSGDMEFGILAEAILGVRSIALCELQPVLPTLGGVRGDYTKGLTADRTAVLDGFAILSDRQLVVEEAAA